MKGEIAPEDADSDRGKACFSTSTLISGKHNLTATYNGSANFGSSSGTLVQTVN
jgi:large repetitive protein